MHNKDLVNALNRWVVLQIILGYAPLTESDGPIGIVLGEEMEK